MLVQAILVGLVGAFGCLDYQLGTLYAFRPIVLCPLVGLVLGDLQTGLAVGASLELLFMGSISIGAYVPPDETIGGVLACAFAIQLGQSIIDGCGVAANILPAMGFAMLGRLVLTKQLVPFYFLGFLLCSYANVPVLGVALIAIIIGIDKFDLLGLGGAQPQLSAEGDEDDDF